MQLFRSLAIVVAVVLGTSGLAHAGDSAYRPGKINLSDAAWCWPGQRYDFSQDVCDGAPRCPDGLLVLGDDCVAAPGTQTAAATPTTETAATATPDPDADQMGHFPLIELSMVSALTAVPFHYTYDHGSGPYQTTQHQTGFVVGGEVRLHVDLGHMVVFGDGLYNVLHSGVRGWARGGVVIGWRSSMNLVQVSDSPEDSEGYYTQTSTTYLKRHVPVVYGLLLGASVVGMNGTQYVDAVDGTFTHDPTALVTGEVGLGMISPQLTIKIAPTFEVTTGKPGLSYEMKYGMPVGHHIIYARFTGDHWFGSDDDKRLGMVFALSLGMSSGVGVAPG